jgi:hypothetical protein
MSMHRIITAGAVALFVGATPAQASLSQLNANWYTLPSNHVDVNVSITGTVLSSSRTRSGRTACRCARASRPLSP